MGHRSPTVCASYKESFDLIYVHTMYPKEEWLMQEEDALLKFGNETLFSSAIAYMTLQ